jgi:hypothetical protein
MEVAVMAGFPAKGNMDVNAGHRYAFNEGT